MLVELIPIDHQRRWTGELEQMESSDNPLIQGMIVWVNQGPDARFSPYHPQWGQMATMLNEGMDRIIYQGADAEATLNEVTDQSNALLAAS